jgi:hypothetical protein
MSGAAGGEGGVKTKNPVSFLTGFFLETMRMYRFFTS